MEEICMSKCKDCRHFCILDSREEGFIFTHFEYYCEENNYYVKDNDCCSCFQSVPYRESGSKEKGMCKNCKYLDFRTYRDDGIFSRKYYCINVNEFVNEKEYCSEFNGVAKLETSDDGCFLTSACVDYYKKEDNCEELETLRAFRDNYLLSTPSGQDLIKQYYEIAPKIVEKINASEKKGEYYQYIYSIIEICIKLINEYKYEYAQNEYINMTKYLVDKLL